MNKTAFDAEKFVEIDIDNDTLKTIVKEAITEWLDTRYNAAMRWTFRTVIAGVIGGIAWVLVSVEFPTWLVNHFYKVK